MQTQDIAVFIPIVAIVMGIGIGMLSIWSEHKRKAQLLEQLHRERMLALEKGVEPPTITPGLVGFLNSKAQPPPRHMWPRAMRTGLWFLFGGVILYFAIEEAGGHEGALFTLVFAAVGLANLIYAAVLWKQEKDTPAQARTPTEY
ncbi:MAG: hypothetical protein ABI821_13795 [Pseudomonadota bacterium]